MIGFLYYEIHYRGWRYLRKLWQLLVIHRVGGLGHSMLRPGTVMAIMDTTKVFRGFQPVSSALIVSRALNSSGIKQGELNVLQLFDSSPQLQRCNNFYNNTPLKINLTDNYSMYLHNSWCFFVITEKKYALKWILMIRMKWSYFSMSQEHVFWKYD